MHIWKPNIAERVCDNHQEYLDGIGCQMEIGLGRFLQISSNNPKTCVLQRFNRNLWFLPMPCNWISLYKDRFYSQGTCKNIHLYQRLVECLQEFPEGSDVDWVVHERVLPINRFDRFDHVNPTRLVRSPRKSHFCYSVSICIYLYIIYFCSPPARWGSLPRPQWALPETASARCQNAR